MREWGGECECDAGNQRAYSSEPGIWMGFLANRPDGFRPCVKVRPHTRNVEVLLERAAIGYCHNLALLESGWDAIEALFKKCFDTAGEEPVGERLGRKKRGMARKKAEKLTLTSGGRWGYELILVHTITAHIDNSDLELSGRESTERAEGTIFMIGE